MKTVKQLWLGFACCSVLGFSSTAFPALSCSSADYANCYTNTAYSRTNPNTGVTTQFSADIFKASWQVVAGNILNVSIQAETTGWIAIGFHKSGVSVPSLMDDTDFVIGGYNSGTYGGDYFYTSTGPGCPNCAPTLDDSQDVLESIASESNGITSLSFSLNLNTSDSTGDYDLTSGLYDVVWAFRNGGSSGDDLTQYHNGGRNVLAAGVKFSTVPVPAAVWLFGSVIFGFMSSFRLNKVIRSVV